MDAGKRSVPFEEARKGVKRRRRIRPKKDAAPKKDEKKEEKMKEKKEAKEEMPEMGAAERAEAMKALAAAYSAGRRNVPSYGPPGGYAEAAARAAAKAETIRLQNELEALRGKRMAEYAPSDVISKLIRENKWTDPQSVATELSRYYLNIPAHERREIEHALAWRFASSIGNQALGVAAVAGAGKAAADFMMSPPGPPPAAPEAVRPGQEMPVKTMDVPDEIEEEIIADEPAAPHGQAPTAAAAKEFMPPVLVRKKEEQYGGWGAALWNLIGAGLANHDVALGSRTGDSSANRPGDVLGSSAVGREFLQTAGTALARMFSADQADQARFAAAEFRLRMEAPQTTSGFLQQLELARGGYARAGYETMAAQEAAVESARRAAFGTVM